MGVNRGKKEKGTSKETQVTSPVVEVPSSLSGVLPKSFTGAAKIGTEKTRGEGIVVGVIDSGVDWCDGLRVCPDGSEKVLCHFLVLSLSLCPLRGLSV
jgi:hypothetical protein